MQTVDGKKVKKKRLGDFWRAVKFIGPYRRLLIISIVAALFVGFTSTTGITLILPIMRLLLEGDTVSGYVDRTITESRLGVRFDDTKSAENTGGYRIVRVNPKSPAQAAGIQVGDILARHTTQGTPTLALLADNSQPIISIPIDSLTSGQRQVPVAIPAAPLTSLVQKFVYPPVRAIANRLPDKPIPALMWLLGGLLGLQIVGGVFRFFQEHCSDMAAIRSVNDIRRKTYDHVLHVPLAYFGQRGTSDVTSRLVADAASMQDGFKLLLGQSIQAPILAAMYLAVALYNEWRLTTFIICCAPISMTVIRKLGKKVRRATRTALEKNSRMLGQLEASLAGIQVVKASLAERFERRKYSHIMSEVVEQQRRMSRYEALTTPTMEALTMFVVAVVVLVAAYYILVDKSLEKETFFLVMACLVGMGDSLRKISKLNNLLQKANAASARIFEVLDMPVERRRELLVAGAKTSGEPALLSLPEIRDNIRFENVTFKYPSTDVLALDHITLEVPRGHVVAVVGRNGSGKTTLLRLLPRLYDPTSGRVLIDGVDIARATLPSLRGQISLVTQESIIFPGTIHDNIAYGLPLTPRSAVIEAAQRAFAHEFITARPEGYDRQLEGIGGGLSGGQRQRLCIARAILRRAPILILDEATSQVDAESEHLIQKAIDSLMHVAHGGGGGGGTTTFVIAHRFSTILSADEIIVMDKGAVVGRGRHKDLLDSCPTYKQLYERQMMG